MSLSQQDQKSNWDDDQIDHRKREKPARIKRNKNGRDKRKWRQKRFEKRGYE